LWYLCISMYPCASVFSVSSQSSIFGSKDPCLHGMKLSASCVKWNAFSLFPNALWHLYCVVYIVVNDINAACSESCFICLVQKRAYSLEKIHKEKKKCRLLGRNRIIIGVQQAPTCSRRCAKAIGSFTWRSGRCTANSGGEEKITARRGTFAWGTFTIDAS